MREKAPDIEIAGGGPDPSSLDFALEIKTGGRVVGKIPAKYGLFVWSWALEVVGAGGTVDLSDLLPDATYAVFIPDPNG